MTQVADQGCFLELQRLAKAVAQFENRPVPSVYDIDVCIKIEERALSLKHEPNRKRPLPGNSSRVADSGILSKLGKSVIKAFRSELKSTEVPRIIKDLVAFEMGGKTDRIQLESNLTSVLRRTRGRLPKKMIEYIEKVYELEPSVGVSRLGADAEQEATGSVQTFFSALRDCTTANIHQTILDMLVETRQCYRAGNYTMAQEKLSFCKYLLDQVGPIGKILRIQLDELFPVDEAAQVTTTGTVYRGSVASGGVASGGVRRPIAALAQPAGFSTSAVRGLTSFSTNYSPAESPLLPIPPIFGGLGGEGAGNEHIWQQKVADEATGNVVANSDVSSALKDEVFGMNAKASTMPQSNSLIQQQTLLPVRSNPLPSSLGSQCLIPPQAPYRDYMGNTAPSSTHGPQIFSSKPQMWSMNPSEQMRIMSMQHAGLMQGQQMRSQMPMRQPYQQQPMNQMATATAPQPRSNMAAGAMYGQPHPSGSSYDFYRGGQLQVQNQDWRHRSMESPVMRTVQNLPTVPSHIQGSPYDPSLYYSQFGRNGPTSSAPVTPKVVQLSTPADQQQQQQQQQPTPADQQQQQQQMITSLEDSENTEIPGRASADQISEICDDMNIIKGITHKI